MSFRASPIDEVLLTRTTLQIEGSLPTASVARMIQALQRVPGVLLAEMHADDSGVVVAHDPAVQTSSLVVAATSAGVHAAIMVDPQTAPIRIEPTLVSNAFRYRPILAFAMAVYAVIMLTDILLPQIAAEHWVLPLVVASLWLSYFTVVILRRRA
jgi:hypothetical protein